MHISKVKNGGGWTQLKGHMERDHAYYKNNVDLSKSHQNITIRDYMTAEELQEHIKDSGVNRKIRPDAVVALNIVCTVPKEEEHYPGDMHDWGERVIQATCKSLGIDESHLAGAEVHMDETSPHVHFSLIPIVEDSSGNVKLSAKDILTKERLQHLHDDVQQYMRAYGYDGMYVNADKDVRGLSKESLPELKSRKHLQEDLAELRADISAQEIDLHNLRERSKTLSNEILQKQNEITQKEGFLERLEAKIEEFYSKVEDMFAKMVDGFKKGIDERKPPIVEAAREQFTRDYTFSSLEERFKNAYKESAMSKADKLKDQALQKIKDAGELELSRW